MRSTSEGQHRCRRAGKRAHVLWEYEVMGSNPVAPTNRSRQAETRTRLRPSALASYMAESADYPNLDGVLYPSAAAGVIGVNIMLYERAAAALPTRPLFR